MEIESNFSKDRNYVKPFELALSNTLQGDIGEVVFKHYCHKNKFAYIRLEKIFKTFRRDNKLEFKYQNQLITVEIPKEIADEVWDVSKPSNGKVDKPTYVFDYLTLCMDHYFENIEGVWIKNEKPFHKKAFSWTEIKTGESNLTENQSNWKTKTQIQLKIFRIKSDFSQSFQVFFENRNEFKSKGVIY